MYNINEMWLGSRESHLSVKKMQEAKDNGTLLSMMVSDNKVTQLSTNKSPYDDERIGANLVEVIDSVAIVNVLGAMVPNHEWYNEFFGITSYQAIKDALTLVSEDDNIGKIILNVNSPGGSVCSLDDLGDYIKFIDNNIKPVLGYTSSHAHSAGYWLLTSCRSISAARMASLGSIGVIMTLVNYKAMLDKEGIEYHYFRSGKFKALGQSGEELTEEAKGEFTDMVMQLHDFFVGQVISGRGQLATQKMSEWKEGKTFLAEQAKNLGLIDEIKSFDLFIAKMLKNGNNGFMGDNTINSLTKGTIMKMKTLTEEQKAKLASGANLEDLGLSAEDLEKAKTELKADAESKDQSADSDNNADIEAKDESKESQDSAAIETLLTENAKLNKSLAKAEVKLEALEAEIKVLAEEKEKTLSLQNKLMAIAAEATNKFQVAVGAQATNLDGFSPEALLTQYEASKKTFEDTIKVGASSVQLSESRDNQDSLKPKNPIRKLT